MNYQTILAEIKSLANPTRAKNLSWFFKTGPGEYGEGDKFLGLTVPQVRSLVKIYWDLLDLSDIEKLLHSPIHECRLFALLVLAKHYPRYPKKVFDLYLKNTKYINNWDLVDISSRDISGRYCFETKDYSILYKLSKSQDLWEKRISITSTNYLIHRHIFSPTLTIAKTLLVDPHDLIHKGVGWMLREVGKVDQKTLTDFLDVYTLKMPRTALRYAIERLPEDCRFHYLKLKA